MTTQKKKLSGKRLWIPLVIILLLAAGSSGYLIWRNRAKLAAEAAASPYQTTQVRQGDINRSATGSGSLVAGSEADLAFPVAGTVGKVNVSMGDKVTAGEELASLDGLDRLNVALETKKIALNTAQKNLDKITQNAGQTLAQAQITLADAQAALADAEDNLLSKGQERCNDKLTSRYYYQYLDALKYFNIWQGELSGESKYGRDFILEHMNKYKSERDTAYANWAYCNAYTDQEIANSQAALQVAKANLGAAQSNAQMLAENHGIDPSALAIAQAALKNAQAEAAVAENNLNAAVITAPMDATVLSISAQAGEPVGTATFIVLADLEHPAIQLRVDETDLQNIAVGCSASVSFDSIPNRTFQGNVRQISPQLVTTFGASTVEATLNLTSPAAADEHTLPIGLIASAEVTCGQANNVLLIPVEALHKQADGTTVVYVLTADGKVEQRVVETGMQDYTNAEIRSGLQAGELVITQGPGIPG